MSKHPWFCDYCCHQDGAAREERPHECMIVSVRLTISGQFRQYVCCNCSQAWERTVDGWRRWFAPAPLWEPQKAARAIADDPIVVPTRLG